MNREDLLRKLENEEELSPMESALLDAYLDEEAGTETLRAIQALKREDPSFAWRARLNERLSQAAGRVRRRAQRKTVLTASTVVALAAVSLFFVYTGSKSEVRETVNLASYLYEWHEEASAAVLLPGTGSELISAEGRSGSPTRDEVDELLFGKGLVDPL